MKQYLNIFILFLLASCSGQGGGTEVVNPPTKPQSSLTTQYSDLFNQTALFGSSSDTSLREKSLTRLNTPNSNWESLVPNGIFRKLRNIMSSFDSFQAKVSTAITNDTTLTFDSAQLSALSHTFDIDGLTPTVWDVRMELVTGDTGQRIMYQSIREHNSDKISFYGKFILDEDNVPKRGIFIFINGNLFNVEGQTSDAVINFMYAFDYDIEDRENIALSSVSIEQFDQVLGHSVLNFIYQQCDADRDNCLAERIALDHPSPDRTLSNTSFRMGWNNTNSQICTASTSYAGATTTLGTTEGFVGPDTPTDPTTTGSCTISSPIWASVDIEASTLFPRNGDGISGGIPELAYGADGTSENTWFNVLEDILIGQFLGDDN